MEENISQIESTYTKVSGYGIVHTLDLYVQDGVQSSEIILNLVDNKREELAEILYIADSFGMLNSLVGLQLIVDIFATPDVKEWFKDLLSDLEDYSLIRELADKYITEQSLAYAEISPSSEDVNSRVLFSTDNRLSSFIWKNIDKNTREPKDYDRLVGIWRLGIYSSKDSEEYKKRLETTVFPYLILRSHRFNNTDPDYSISYSIFNLIINTYLLDLLSLDTITYNNLLERIIDFDVNKVAVESSMDFHDLINELISDSGNGIYATESYVNSIYELIRICERYKGNKSLWYTGDIKSRLPMLYLLVGKNDDAYKFLDEMIRSSEAADLFHCAESLIAFYRCMLITSDESKRKNLINAFNEVFTNRGVDRELSEVISDFAGYYDAWTERLKSEVLVYPDPDFECFCNEYISNDKIKNRFHDLRKATLSTDVVKKSKAIDEALDLITGLSSHYDSYIRINYHGVKRAFPEDAILISDPEIYYYNLYTPNELNNIKVLRERLQKIGSNRVPSNLIYSYLKIRDKVIAYWYESDSTILCSKILIALRGIQSDPINLWRNGPGTEPKLENSLNRLVAFFLKGFYGEGSIRCEEPQGISLTTISSGELDITVLKNGCQFAIIEALRLTNIKKSGELSDTSKDYITDHVRKLMINYDSLGDETKILIIYAYIDKAELLYDEVRICVEDYFTKNINTLFDGYTIGKLEMIQNRESSICHHKLDYRNEGHDKELHVFTVLMKA